VVEDDPLNQQYLKLLLRHDYTVDAAFDAEEAFEKLAQQTFDLVVLDIMLPGLSGLDMLKQLRSHPDTAQIPVILVSAKANPDDVARGLQLGASDYITKPIEQNVLLARLETQLKIKELSDEKDRTIQRLEEAKTLNGQLSRIASHDLKNPLHNIQIAGHLLRDEVNGNDRALQLLDGIDMGITTMRGIIRDFMDLIALQTGAIEFTMEAVWLWEVIIGIAMQYEIPAEKKDITIELKDIEGEVIADRSRLEQIMANLVSNAVKYSPIGSTVSIWTETHNGCVRLCVADDGAGVPEAERELLFQEFAQISTRPTGGEDSSGLGLWIVRHLATHQNGQVGADFPDDGGSVFWVQLPSVDHPDSSC
jgi:two-component system sensor histidine kinase/response regulator